MSFDSQDAMHTLGSHRVYIHGINKIKSFVSNFMYPTVVNTIVKTRSAVWLLEMERGRGDEKHSPQLHISLTVPIPTREAIL